MRGFGKGEMRELCSDILAEGRSILDSGYNARIGCVDHRYQRLRESGLSEKEAMNRCSHDNTRPSKREEMYAIADEMIRTAKKICAAGYNARFACMGEETK